MVIDDLTLKGAIEPSSIWTVICMLAKGSKHSLKSSSCKIGSARIDFENLSLFELRFLGPRMELKSTCEVN